MKAALVFLTFWLVGCALETTKYDLLALDGIGWNTDKKVRHKGKRVEVESCLNTVLMFVPLTWPSSQEELIRSAVAKVPKANALADAEIKSTILFGILYNRICESVEGVPITM